MAEFPEDSPRRPASGVVLPEDPSLDELARDWTLSEADVREVLLCRGPDNCLRFALDLCVLRRYGRFFESDATPVRCARKLGIGTSSSPGALAVSSDGMHSA
ncbi:MAG TPA: DUF4158 domain-containing protein [Terriglobia bacterium]|nr:DUF4158 domain-containing protein [Terriglobia bacterium]